jgi:hypothetical protein
VLGLKVRIAHMKVAQLGKLCYGAAGIVAPRAHSETSPQPSPLSDECITLQESRATPWEGRCGG